MMSKTLVISLFIIGTCLFCGCNHLEKRRIPGKTDEPRRFYWNYWNIRMAIRDGDWKLVIPKGNAPPELYYLGEDPYEKNDLAGKEPDKLNQMLQLLELEKSFDQKDRAPWLPKIENE